VVGFGWFGQKNSKAMGQEEEKFRSWLDSKRKKKEVTVDSKEVASLGGI